ncbi:fos-related antigen 2 [Danio aesculapii]|uniref:fos-related antigen 2 n=1 Tax=Danio aesculapii TaxID=1142201 RepID=UPI0024C0CEAD|nr:fos-related antigen 2 [Danio aesculapii]
MEFSEPTCSSEEEISNSISWVEMQRSKSPFIATVNAVASRQELRWIIEPVMQSESLDHSKGDAQLSPDEEEKRRRRRERNKMAAAKCRNRRKELTDLLQEESERLYMEQVGLQKQVSCLQQEKEQLKMLLASHASICTLENPLSLDNFQLKDILPSRTAVTIKQEPLDGISTSRHFGLEQAVELTEEGPDLH